MGQAGMAGAVPARDQARGGRLYRNARAQQMARRVRADVEGFSRRARDLLCRWQARSEEHTSELPSLMRISYADFCLNKKKQTSKALSSYTQNLYVITQHTHT